jgi:hypothetical protein
MKLLGISLHPPSIALVIVTKVYDTTSVHVHGLFTSLKERLDLLSSAFASTELSIAPILFLPSIFPSRLPQANSETTALKVIAVDLNTCCH